jgi:hypothetical protein
MICQPPDSPSPARIAATTMSGHPVPMPNTPKAAATTAMLPIASLREHIQTDRRLAISGERERAHDAHCLGGRERSPCRHPNGAAEYPCAQQDQRAALRQRRTRTPAERKARDPQADRIVRRVTKEVERIGLERCRLRRHAGCDLDTKHGSVDRQRDPQCASPCLIFLLRSGDGTTAATTSCHAVTSHSFDDTLFRVCGSYRVKAWH